MIESIQALLRLQEVDLCLEAARREADQLSPQREAAAAERTREEAAAVEAAEDLRCQEQHRRQLESELSEVEAVLEKLDRQLYEITSKHALDALQHEQANARQRKSKHEDAILELMEKIDLGRDVLAGAESGQRDGAVSGATAEEARAERERVLALQMERLEQARRDRLGGLDARLIGAYDNARRKRLPAVAFIEAKSCPSCRIMVAPQRLVDLRSATKLVTCGSCGCILYGDKVLQAEQRG